MMNQGRRQYLLRKLHRRCDGRCQSCRKFTAVIHVVKRFDGWLVFDDHTSVISPKGHIIPAATIEHLIPQAKGGSDDEKKPHLILLRLQPENKTF